MQLGMVGLGRMGANMVRRLMRAGHACVGHGPERRRGGGAGEGRRDRRRQPRGPRGDARSRRAPSG